MKNHYNKHMRCTNNSYTRKDYQSHYCYVIKGINPNSGKDWVIFHGVGCKDKMSSLGCCLQEVVAYESLDIFN